METHAQENTALITLKCGEGFYFKESVLNGYSNFNWCLRPPHLTGSPIMRIIHRCYFKMKHVQANTGEIKVPITGYMPRGNFHFLHIPTGEKHYISVKHLAGFCCRTTSVHTHIKFAPVFWCFREHFFSVFEGPATVLLYGRSAFEKNSDTSFHPSRVVSFNINRAFTAICPRPTTLPSLCYNVLSNAVIWRFIDPGETLTETHHDDDATAKPLTPFDILLHLLGLMKV